MHRPSADRARRPQAAPSKVSTRPQARLSPSATRTRKPAAPIGTGGASPAATSECRNLEHGPRAGVASMPLVMCGCSWLHRTRRSPGADRPTGAVWTTGRRMACGWPGNPRCARGGCRALIPPTEPPPNENDVSAHGLLTVSSRPRYLGGNKLGRIKPGPGSTEQHAVGC